MVRMMGVLLGLVVAGSAGAAPMGVAELAREALTVGPSGRVTLDLKDAEVGAVIERLAAVGRVNVVMSDEVKGRVTLKMRNVGWEEALAAVLSVKGLDQLRDDNVIWVASAATIERERVAREREQWRCTPQTPLGRLEFCKNP